MLERSWSPVRVPSSPVARESTEQDQTFPSEESDSDSTVVAVENMVSESAEHVTADQEDCDEEEDGHQPGRSRGSDPGKESETSRLHGFWSTRPRLRQDLTPSATSLIQSSWRRGTEVNYGTYWRRWARWTREHSIQKLDPSIADVLNFLASMFDQGLSWNSIGGARSALSSTLAPIDGFKIGDHPAVSRLVKGAFNLRPPIQKLVPSWSVNKVLRELSTWPIQAELTLKELTFKTLLLLALVTAHRVDSLPKMIFKRPFSHSLEEIFNVFFLLFKICSSHLKI